MGRHGTPSRPGLAALVAGCALAIAPPAAAEPDVPLSEYVVTSWTTKDGLPSDVIWAVAQDPEGYLWLGTNGGLVRFDGVRFVAVDGGTNAQLPRSPSRSVYVGRDGTLWIGFSERGGISRLRDGVVTNYGEQDGLPRAIITGIIEDRNGVVWAGSGRGLYRRTATDWRAVGADVGLPTGSIDSMYVDRAGNLLVGSGAAVYRKKEGEDRFEEADAFSEGAPRFRGFGEDPSGHLWVTDPHLAFRPLGSPASDGAIGRARGNRLLFNRDGELWVATMNEGLWRVRLDPDCRTRTIEKARLSGARTLFEDRDGNIWAGAGDGLVRFRKPRVMPVTDVGPVEAVEATADGSVWASTGDELIRVDRRPESGLALQRVADRTRIRAIRADPGGALWVATDKGLERFGPGRRTFSLTPGPIALGHINALAADGAGGLWISERERGLFRWHPDRPAAFEAQPRLAGQRVTTLYTDRHARVWFLSIDGRLGWIAADGTTQFVRPEDGLPGGPFLSIYEDSRGVTWVSGFDGLSRLEGHTFVRLNQANRLRGGVASIVEDAEGDLWLGSASGIIWIRRSEIEKWLDQPDYAVNASVFDATDGLAGMPISFGGPSVARAADGQLWFVTGRGLTAFDPMALKGPRSAPRVAIENVTVDEHGIQPEAGLMLPAQSSRLLIDYTALDLSAPMHLRFKYRLEGFDADWIEAGTRRQALYTNLPPRTYRFQVAARTIDGSWTEATAVWDFSIRPKFYQTTAFLLSVVAVGGLVVWAGWWLRMRHVRRQFLMLLGERARLSREIHDTLLQSLVGVALQFDAVSSGLDPRSPVRLQLVKIRKQIEEYIRDARHSIWNLRRPTLDSRDLTAALREAAERARAGRQVEIAFRQSGAAVTGSRDAEEQLARICHEAVSNAIRHGHASGVDVNLLYEPGAILLRIADNGCGFDPTGEVDPEVAGHYGLVSMKERAEQVGGRLTVSSRTDAGTIVEARVPTHGPAGVWGPLHERTM